MDLNQLFSNHQVALFNAHQATSVDERQTYGELVEHYAARIRSFRDHRDLPRYEWAR